MRTLVFDTLQDIAFDPSFIEIVSSGPVAPWQDVLVGLLGLVAWTIVARLLGRLFWALAQRAITATSPLSLRLSSEAARHAA
ncbi:MAG: hypothetical protein WC807_10195 [Hyphomicrobium sp.]|jgi:hypothetical protein